MGSPPRLTRCSLPHALLRRPRLTASRRPGVSGSRASGAPRVCAR
jgi:hypothetical protein